MSYDARSLVGMVALGVLEDLRQETASRAERDSSLRPLVDLTLPSVHHPPCAYRSDMSYDATRRRLDGLTDHVGFERLVMILLTRTGINASPLGGPGDRNRDAVAGLYRAAGGEPLAVTISLARRWERKIRTDLKRIHDHGFRPETVISVTNRPAPAPAQAALQAQVKKQYGVDLTIHEQRWLVTQFHRRDNLDLLGEYLNLLPPQPRFFLDLSEFEKLLEERGLLTAPFAGRREELDEVERLLTDQGRAVIIEAPGGFGKTRLAVELARSGRSIPWFFVDYGLAFQTNYLAEAEAGYPVTVLIDDAHRRTDLDQLLRALERRDPKPRLVCTVRPGHAAVVETALHGLALPQPERFRLDWLGRSALNTILSGPPFGIEREGMRSWIITVSQGNVGVALIAGELAAAGHYPSELSQAELFAQHVNVRLHGAGVESRQTRELLAVVAGVGSLDLGDADDVAAAIEILGGDRPQLRRRLDELADLGVVEEATRIYTITPDVVREHLLRASYFPEAGERPLQRYQDLYAAFAPRRLYALLEALGQARVDTTPAAADALATIRRDLVALLEQATTAGELENVMLAAQALGAGAGAIVGQLAEATLDRLDRLDDDAADQVAVRLVEALGGGQARPRPAAAGLAGAVAPGDRRLWTHWGASCVRRGADRDSRYPPLGPDRLCCPRPLRAGLHPARRPRAEPGVVGHGARPAGRRARRRRCGRRRVHPPARSRAPGRRAQVGYHPHRRVRAGQRRDRGPAPPRRHAVSRQLP